MVLLNAMSNDKLPGLREWRWTRDMLDSAVRFEAEKTRGKPSILWQQDSPKKNDRKFGYTKKNLRHPVRKIYQEPPVSTYNTIRNGKPPENFIKKNRESLGKSDTSATDSKITPNTVTLTQEQLNAILASVGRLNSSGKENELHLTIDSEKNEIHIKKSPRLLTSQENSQNDAQTNILSFESDDKQHDFDTRVFNRNSSDVSSTHEMQKEKSHMEYGNHTNNAVANDPNAALPPLVHRRHMTVGERKRLQWAREREEMQQTPSDPWSRQSTTYHNTSALSGPFYTEGSLPPNTIPSAPGSRRGLVEHTPTSMKSVIEQTPLLTKGAVEPRNRPVENGEKADTYDPWGKPGGGARHNPIVKPDGQDSGTFDFMGRPIIDNSLTKEMYTVKSRQQQNSLDQKREWMTELENQMEEQKQRKIKERNLDKTLGDMSWLDRFTTDHKPAPLPEQLTSVQNRSSRLDVL